MHVPIAARLESARVHRAGSMGFNAHIKGSRPGSAVSSKSPLKATYAFPDGLAFLSRLLKLARSLCVACSLSLLCVSKQLENIQEACVLQ